MATPAAQNTSSVPIPYDLDTHFRDLTEAQKITFGSAFSGKSKDDTITVSISYNGEKPRDFNYTINSLKESTLQLKNEKITQDSAITRANRNSHEMASNNVNKAIIKYFKDFNIPELNEREALKSTQAQSQHQILAQAQEPTKIGGESPKSRTDSLIVQVPDGDKSSQKNGSVESSRSSSISEPIEVAAKPKFDPKGITVKFGVDIKTPTIEATNADGAISDFASGVKLHSQFTISIVRDGKASTQNYIVSAVKEGKVELKYNGWLPQNENKEVTTSLTAYLNDARQSEVAADKTLPLRRVSVSSHLNIPAQIESSSVGGVEDNPSDVVDAHDPVVQPTTNGTTKPKTHMVDDSIVLTWSLGNKYALENDDKEQLLGKLREMKSGDKLAIMINKDNTPMMRIFNAADVDGALRFTEDIFAGDNGVAQGLTTFVNELLDGANSVQSEVQTNTGKSPNLAVTEEDTKEDTDADIPIPSPQAPPKSQRGVNNTTMAT